MLKKAMISMSAVALMAVAANANVTYQPFLGVTTAGALTADGQPIVQGTYVMLIDLDNDGWDGHGYLQTGGKPNTWQWDSNDLVMDRGSIDNGVAFPSYISPSGDPVQTITGYTPGVDQVYLLWFDEPYSPSAQGPGGGIHYGAELLTTALSDGGTFTDFANGGPASLTTATVPEPASALALVAAGSLLLTGRRRRHA